MSLLAEIICKALRSKKTHVPFACKWTGLLYISKYKTIALMTWGGVVSK